MEKKTPLYDTHVKYGGSIVEFGGFLLPVQYETGIKKFGAMLGDHVEVGCNSVLNPGTIIGRNSSIYPTSNVRGVVPENSIYKTPGGSVITRIN